jgi:hypothetical protein
MMPAVMATESQTRPLQIESDMSADREHHGQGEASVAHLSPQEASRTKCAGFVEAQAKQAKEHNKQQDDIGREAAENVKIGNVRAGHYTSNVSRYRFNADLGMDESRESTTIQVDCSPGQWLVPWRRLKMGF